MRVMRDVQGTDLQLHTGTSSREASKLGRVESTERVEFLLAGRTGGAVVSSARCSPGTIFESGRPMHRFPPLTPIPLDEEGRAGPFFLALGLAIAGLVFLPVRACFDGNGFSSAGLRSDLSSR